MSLLADWYFCTAMRLSPADTHAFLDTLGVLRRTDAERADLLDAAEALKSSPSWLQLYALRPLLTAHGRLADRTAATADGAPGPEGAEVAAERRERAAERVEEGRTQSGYGDAELGRRIGELCEAVLATTDHPLAAHLGTVLGAVIQDADGARRVLLKDITKPLAEEPRGALGPDPSPPYHDLNDHIVPTVTVIALAELTRRRPTSAAQDWLGENADPVAAAALRGEYGRLALLTAVEASGRADPQARDEVWRNLWLDGRGAPHLQPDLLDALSRLWFGHPDTEDPPSVAELETEAVTGDDLALWARARRHDTSACAEFYALLTGHTNGAWDAMGAVLWQSVLWSLAAEVDPAGAAARLARWWRTPRRTPGETVTVHVGRMTTRATEHLSLLHQLSRAPGSRVVVDEAPVDETGERAGSTVCSPWVDRWHDGWDHMRRNGPAFRFGSSGPSEPLVRLLAAASLSVSLLAALPEAREEQEHDHLTALVLHTVDVLRDQATLLTDLELGEYTGDHPLGPALASLVWHVYRVLQETGAGHDPRVDPRRFAAFAARVLEDDASADLEDNEQSARLARQAVGAICTMWIRRAWVESSAIRPEEGPGRWFLGDPPLALRVLMAGLDRLSLLLTQFRALKQQESRRRGKLEKERARQQPGTAAEPVRTRSVSLTRGLWTPDLMPTAQLLKEIYPADWPDPVGSRWPQLDLDWYGQRDGLRKLYEPRLRRAGDDPEAVTVNTVRAERLLLSPRYPLQVWRESTPDLEGWARVDSAPITMRALRLVALLQDHQAVASDGYREWIEDWLDRIHAVQRREELSLDVRAIMIRLLAPAVPGGGVDYERLLSSVHGATVDAIMEFGSSTPRHIEMLLEQLAGSVGLAREATDRLRLRALETIYRQRQYRGQQLTLWGVSEVRRERDAAVNRELAIRRYLDGIAASAHQESERVPVLERAHALWARTQLRPLLSGTRVPLTDRRHRRGEGVPELIVAATATDRFRAEEISYLLDVVSPATVRSPRRTGRVHDLFPSERYRQQMLQEITKSVRTVFAVVTEVEDARVWLNAGLGTPLPYDGAPEGLGVRTGDVVAAEIRGGPAAVVSVRRLPWPEPEPGEVRTATVRMTRPWLRVEVDGVSGAVYPNGDGAVADSVRRRWDPDLSRAFSGQGGGPVTVPVRWDGELRHWVPVERSLSELIVKELDSPEGARLVHAGGDLFVTRPGFLYRLTDADWEDPEAVAALLDGQPGGVILQVDRAATGGPRLRVTADDSRNVRWLRLFSGNEHEFTIATKSDRGYRIEVDPPEGFPPAVVARGAEGGPQRAYVITAPWSERQARLAEVTVTLVPVSGVKDRHFPTVERFEEVCGVAVGARVTLRRIFSHSLENALVWATTSTGVAVRLETDSLTLLNPEEVGRSAGGMVSGRAADVVRVYKLPVPRPPGSAMTVEELATRVHTDGADTAEVRRQVSSADVAEGVVVARASAPGQGGDTIYGTWCRFGDQVHYVELPQEHLGATIAQLVGQTFVGTRDGAQWTFRFSPREITVRALFEVRTGADVDGPEVFVGSDGTADLYQHPTRPVLVRRPAAGGDAIRRLDLATADVTLLDRRPITMRTVAVRTRKDSVVLFGGSSFREDVGDAQVVGVRLDLTPSRSGRGDRVRARRTFSLRARSASAPRRVQQVDHAGRWQRFLAAGHDHVTGSLAKTHVDITGGLRPPGPDGKLSARLPLLPGEEPAVAGVPYRTLGVRVRLVPHGDGYAASYATATPKTLPEFMRLMHQEVTAGDVSRPFADALYYVSPPTAQLDAHVFEWGYGWTVAVPAGRLSVAGTPDRRGLPPLFHGDRIEAASFVAADDGGDPVMVIAWRDIRPRYVTQIVDERRQQYLHLLDVEVGVATGTLRVMRAQAGRRRGDDPFRSAEWVPFPATLDDDSRKLVLEQLRQSGETGLVRRRILARFDNETAISTGGRERMFQAVRADGAGLRDKDRVFLTARQIEQTSNELTVIFGIPDALNTEDLSVRVNRREFSFRESTLARLLARGLDVEKAEVVMLVRLTAPNRKGVRHGSIKDGPARRPETLVSYLASRGGSCYAVFGRVATRGAGRLEIAPGVLYGTAGVVGAEEARHGSVVRLVLDDARRVVLTTALPADQSYVGAKGRAAVVFPKSDLLRRNSPERRRDMGSGFVVSGLPDVQASPVNGAGAEVLAAPHPKICWLRESRDGSVELRLASPNEARVARLVRRDADRPAEVRPRVLPGEPRGERDTLPMPWARMSFTYTTAGSIARACAALRWQHHDRYTGHARGDRIVGPYEVSPGSLLFDGVAFDDDAGWTLRYGPDRLAAFGFPAGELLDGPARERPLTVAGVSADGGGVWVELGPGRLVEIRGALVTAEGRTALTGLDWPAFAPGDQIGLSQDDSSQDAHGWEASQESLVLTSWRTTVTGALPRDDRDARVLLPVRGTDRGGGALHLADGQGRLVYPLDRTALTALQGVEAVWLDARNDVEPYTAGSVRPGDTVLLMADEHGRLTVAGLPDVEVRVAPRGDRNWPGYDWLHRRLAHDSGRRNLLEAFDGQLPVTVHSVGIDRPVVTVSRERQPSGFWPRARQVRTELLAASGRQLLLRSGAAVYSVSLDEAVLGVPTTLAGQVAAALDGATRSRPLVLWWRVDEQGVRQSGLAESAGDAGPQDVVVVLEAEVAIDGAAVGVVCRDVATSRLHWLGADQASWVRDVAAGDLLANLARANRLTARLRPDGSLSVNTRPAVSHQLRRLQLGQSLRLVLGEGRPRPAGDGTWRYIARLEMPPILMSYVSTDPELTPGTSRLTEVDTVDRGGQPSVTTVDANSRRVTLDLPRWLTVAHQAIVEDGSPGAALGRFDEYRRWYREGRGGVTGDAPTEAVVRLAGDLVDGAEVDVRQLREVTTRWMAAHGRAVFNLIGDEEMDAAPLLAGALVMDALAGRDRDWDPVVVLYLHQIGRRAAASLHTEQLATAWVGEPEVHHLGGAWVRLRALSLARELEPRQVRQLREFCRAMLTKPVLRNVENALAPVARSLLAAVGELESAEELLRDATVLAGPATWARTLLPPSGHATAQPTLLGRQREQLRALADHVVNDAVPLTLLPVVAPPFGSEGDLARRVLRNLHSTSGPSPD
ncbi:hypothetical protein OG937_42290 [Streptomyces sp. NBC_00510]